MKIQNTRAELEAEKKLEEAKYGIQIKDEERYFQVLKNERFGNMMYTLVLLILLCALCTAFGFLIGSTFTYDLSKHMTATNVSAFMGLR